MNDIFYPAAWDWLSIWRPLSALGSGRLQFRAVLPFIATEHKRKKEKAAYLALRLAVLFEGYASRCCVGGVVKGGLFGAGHRWFLNIMVAWPAVEAESARF
jgi:hypothetical protein